MGQKPTRPLVFWRTNNQAGGFTVVELMTCMAILAILAVLVGQSGAYYRSKGRSAQCLANMRAIGVGLQAIAADNESRLPSLTEDNVEIRSSNGIGKLDVRYDVSKYDHSLWNVVCPCDPRRNGDPDPANPTYVSYLYLFPGGLDLVAQEKPIMILMDSGYFHKVGRRHFGNFLYSDNRIVFERWPGDPP